MAIRAMSRPTGKSAWWHRHSGDEPKIDERQGAKARRRQGRSVIGHSPHGCRSLRGDGDEERGRILHGGLKVDAGYFHLGPWVDPGHLIKAHPHSHGATGRVATFPRQGGAGDEL